MNNELVEKVLEVNKDIFTLSGYMKTEQVPEIIEKVKKLKEMNTEGVNLFAELDAYLKREKKNVYGTNEKHVSGCYVSSHPLTSVNEALKKVDNFNLLNEVEREEERKGIRELREAIRETFPIDIMKIPALEYGPNVISAKDIAPAEARALRSEDKATQALAFEKVAANGDLEDLKQDIIEMGKKKGVEIGWETDLAREQQEGLGAVSSLVNAIGSIQRDPQYIAGNLTNSREQGIS